MGVITQYDQAPLLHADSEASEQHKPSNDDPGRFGALLLDWKAMVAIVCCNLVMMDMNAQLVYFLLAESTVGCDFKKDYANAQVALYAIMLVWRPLSGYLTDRFPRRSHLILLGACGVELLALVMMAVIVWGNLTWFGGADGRASANVVLVLNVIKSAAEVQLLNSIYKVLKMRIVMRCDGDVNCDNQCAVISGVGVWGEFAELFLNAGTSGVAWGLIHLGGSFDAVKWVYFVVTLAANAVCVGCSLYISQPGYYYKLEESLPIAHQTHAAGKDPPLTVKALEPAEESTWSYFKRAGGNVFGKATPCGVVIHAALLYLPFTLLFASESLRLSHYRLSPLPPLRYPASVLEGEP